MLNRFAEKKRETADWGLDRDGAEDSLNPKNPFFGFYLTSCSIAPHFILNSYLTFFTVFANQVNYYQ